MIANLTCSMRVVLVLILGLSGFWAFPANGAADTEPPPSATVNSPSESSPSSSRPTVVTGSKVKQATDQAPVARRGTAYSSESVLLVVLLVGLLALLFVLLLWWSNRLDQASYLGDVYQESVQDFEYRRLATVPTEKLRNGEYHREIAHDNDFLTKHPRPTPPSGVHVGGDDFWGDDPFAGSSGLPRSGSGIPSREVSESDQKARNEFRILSGEWRNKVDAEASLRYRTDLDSARSRAKERAALATNVDLSALRGRGAEFVLEFTTVVVIIFAAVILGVLDILGTEQIGTLLAAIAGYVLGRATTRTRAGTSEIVAAERPTRARASIEGKSDETVSTQVHSNRATAKK